MAQRPRVLHPERSPLHLLGAHLRWLREGRGLSQSALGQVVFCSGHLIGKVEKGDRRPQQDLIARCDRVLGGQGTLLALGAALDDRDGDTADQPSTAVFDCVPLLRRSLDSRDDPDDGLVRPLEELQADVHRLVDFRLDSRYVDLTLHLPALLPELHRAFQNSHDRQTAALLTQAYRAADAVADKFGLYDLSARIIELMRLTAAQSEDLLNVAVTEYVRAETFFATGDYAAGRRMLEKAASAVEADASVETGAVYGSLHMRAAVLAARGGDLDTAVDHMGEANRAAEGLPEAVYRGTAFGPASVRIHRLSLALDSGDIDAAKSAMTGWTPHASVPAERRSHYFIDRARTQVHTGQDDEAIGSLHVARQIAPQHVRYHADVRATLAVVVARTHRPAQPLTEMCRWTGVLSKPKERDAASPEARQAK